MMASKVMYMQPYLRYDNDRQQNVFTKCPDSVMPLVICYLKSLSSRVRSLISIPESLIAAIVLGSSARAVSASFERDVAALPIAYRNIEVNSSTITRQRVLKRN